MKLFIRVFLTISIFTSLMLPLASLVEAFNSSSTTYRLEGEFGIFGGAKSSTTYNLTDTGGGFAITFGNSASYNSCSGFQCVLAKTPSISFTISGGNVSLGTLSTGSVTSVSKSISVSTVLGKGYQVTVRQDGNLCRIALPCDASNDINPAGGDNDVDQGSEEYGLSTSKSGQGIVVWDGNCNGSNPEAGSAISTSPQAVASANTEVTNDQTTLCYSASISQTTTAGSYTQILTYIATGTF